MVYIVSHLVYKERNSFFFSWRKKMGQANVKASGSCYIRTHAKQKQKKNAAPSALKDTTHPREEREFFIYFFFGIYLSWINALNLVVVIIVFFRKKNVEDASARMLSFDSRSPPFIFPAAIPVPAWTTTAHTHKKKSIQSLYIVSHFLLLLLCVCCVLSEKTQ